MSDLTAWQKLLKVYLKSCTKEDALNEEQIYKDFSRASVSDDIRNICKTIGISEDIEFLYVEDDRALIFTESTCVQIQECETETELIYHESLKVTNVIFEPGTYALEPVKVLFANNRNEEIVIEKQLAIRKDNFEKLVQSKV
jgi:hypothetical protein